MAIEPMNRKAVRPFRATKAQRSEQTERNNYDPVMSISGNAVANFLIVCVSKKVLSITINQLRDGARISDRLVENVIQNISRSWTSNY
jgi:hypothetical protein